MKIRRNQARLHISQYLMNISLQVQQKDYILKQLKRARNPQQKENNKEMILIRKKINKNKFNVCSAYQKIQDLIFIISLLKQLLLKSIVKNMSDIQGYTKISQKFKQIVNTLTTKQLPIVKIFFSDLAKQIASGGDSFLSQFHNLKEMLDSIKQAKGKLPIHYAVAGGNLQVVRYLVEQLKIDYAAKDKQGNNCFFTAIEHSHLNLIKYFIQEIGVSPLSTKDGQIGALHVAANQNSIELVQYFLSKGCDIQKISIYGKPLNWAVGSRHLEVTKYLLEKGADANGDTTCPAPPPLILAVDFQCWQIYEALLNAPKAANLKVKDPQGYSLLHLAAQKGNLKLVKQLIEKGLQVNLEVEGKTPLALAFENNRWEVVNHLRKFTKNSEQIQGKLKEQKQKREKQQPVVVDKPKAEQIKNEGNKYFVQANYAQALQKYKMAIHFDPQNDAIHRNLAACYLHLKNYEQALFHCHKAKQADPKNVKNLYRQAQAYIGLNNLIDGSSSLWQCAMLQPQTPFFRQQFQKYVQLARKQHKGE